MPGYFREIVPDGNDFADLKGLKQGNLRLAVITTAKYFVPRLRSVSSPLSRNQHLSQVTNRQQVLERLSKNLDDLYILGQPPSNLDISLRPVLKIP